MITNNKDRQAKITEIEKVLNRAKGKILDEFEKVCPTERSFEKVKKDIHSFLDKAIEEMKFHI